MTETHDVISAFLDDEPFEPQALDQALADPAGRKLLLDLVALRHLTQVDESVAQPTARKQPRARLFLAAAAVLVALAGGYQLGQRREDDSARPPAPTRVVSAEVAWQEVPNGGIR